MSSIRAVSFDVTHTLIHAPRRGEIYAGVLERHGVHIAPGEAERLIPIVWQEFACGVPSGADRFAMHPEGARGWWRRFLGRLCELAEVPPPSPFAAAELFDRFAHAAAWEIYPDVLPCFTELRAQGLSLAVISNWDERLPTLLERLGLLPFFDVVMISSAVGREKPDARIFHEALRRFGIAPASLLHVGDSRRDDLEGALACGIAALLLERRGTAGGIASLAEIAARIAPAGAPAVRSARR